MMHVEEGGSSLRVKYKIMIRRSLILGKKQFPLVVTIHKYNTIPKSFLKLEIDSFFKYDK